jgi:SAM-dependent methyltransferase
MSDPALPFTGERFTPECVREIWYEHWHRYAFARPLAAGRRVLDAACGEGYGSALLARTATSVTGLDIDPASIAHAQARYAGLANLRYECGDAAALPFAAGSFDLVVSFETLEHLEAQEDLIAGFARVLDEDGLLVISSPDRHVYSELAGFRNEFHVRELYRQEFIDLLAAHFPVARLYGQKLLFQSAIWPLQGTEGEPQPMTAREGGASIEEGLAYAPMYYVAVCAKRQLPAGLPGLSLFGDGEETVYAHYNHEIRKNMAAGQRIAELEAELARLRAEGQPDRGRRWWRRKP